MPVNYLLIESLQKFHKYYGSDFKVECPTGSGRYLTIGEVANELARRLSRIFLKDESGAAGLQSLREDAGRSAFPGLRPLLRIFPRRQRARCRRIAPDGWTGLVANLLKPDQGGLKL